jgi:hypothetical protein
MERNTALALPYDNCLLSNCIRKLFSAAHRVKTAPPFVVTDQLSSINDDLTTLNIDGRMELSHEYLHTMQHTLPDTAFRYVVVYRNNTPVLFTYFQLFTLTAHNFKLHEDKGFMKGLLRFFLQLKKAKLLVAGNSLRNETPSFCYNDQYLSKEEATELIAAAAEHVASEDSATVVMLKDLPAFTKGRKTLSGMGYITPVPDEVMNMEVDKNWKELPDYIGALSRKYKTRANKILTSASDLTLRQLGKQDITKHQAVIYRLFRNVVSSQPFMLTIPSRDHFTKLSELYGEDFELWGYFSGDNLMAFYSAFTGSNYYEVYYVGFDYEHNGKHNLYFNLLFASLQRAISLRKKQLRLGRTSFDAKASLGAEPTEIKYMVKAAGLPQLVSKWVISYFSAYESAKWKLRNPLKTEKASA